jgi:hypothetical protein
MKYFEMDDFAEIQGRWWLKTPRDASGALIDPELFCNGQLLDLRPPLTISIRYDGEPLDWTFADFDMPVVSKRTADLLRSICGDDFQSFDATIEGYNGDFEVLNILKVIGCLDEQKSDILFWKEEDGRPDKVGQYRQVANMRIDSSQIGGANMFRIAGWEIALIVSEHIRRAFIDHKISGVRFVEV